MLRNLVSFVSTQSGPYLYSGTLKRVHRYCEMNGEAASGMAELSRLALVFGLWF